MQQNTSVDVEPLYSVQQVAQLWHVGMEQVRKIFRGRAGVINIGSRQKPSWRIPASLVLQVMVERGYSQDARYAFDRLMRGEL